MDQQYTVIDHRRTIDQLSVSPCLLVGRLPIVRPNTTRAQDIAIECHILSYITQFVCYVSLLYLILM